MEDFTEALDNLKQLDDYYYAMRKVIPVGHLGLVGGCVRDTLLGQKPKDYDFATDLLPKVVEDYLRFHHVGKICTIGRRYGTLGFNLKVNDVIVPVNISTFREECYDGDNHKPKVKFTKSVVEDLKRRDFTINSLFYGHDNDHIHSVNWGKDGKGADSDSPSLVNPFMGLEHLLEYKLLDPVGVAEESILEDPLRILRGVRFACQCNLSIAGDFLEECKDSLNLLLEIPVERVTEELDKLLVGPNAGRGIEILGSLGILDLLLPELVMAYFPYTVADPDEAWALLLNSVGGVLENKVYGSVLHNDWQRHDWLCKGICARFNFSRKRVSHIMYDQKNIKDLTRARRKNNGA